MTTILNRIKEIEARLEETRTCSDCSSLGQCLEYNCRTEHFELEELLEYFKQLLKEKEN